MKRRYICAIVSGTALLGACAGPMTPVPESDRDASGTHDGRWVGTLDEGVKSVYSSGNWTKNCTSTAATFYFDVDDGVMSFPIDDVAEAETPTTYVDSGGGFRLVVPRGQHEISSRESGSIPPSTIRWIVAGKLEEGPGNIKFTVGDSQFGGGGCSWKLDVVRA